MTTGIVMSVTDELVEQLNALTCRDEGGAVVIHADQMRALLAERAELLRDADCLRWLLDQGDNTQWQNILRIEVDDYATVRDAINEVMRQECKP